MNEIKQAMILAAGLGERARPLSSVKHKALFPILNRPIIAYVLDVLKEAGISRLVVNTHHLGTFVAAELRELAHDFDLTIIFEDEILGTGGGVKNAAPNLASGPFVLINSVVITDLDLKKVIGRHQESGASATLVFHDNPRFNLVPVDGQNNIMGFRNDWAGSPDEQGWRMLAFTGIHVFEPEVLEMMPAGSGDIIHTYQKMIKKGRKVAAFVDENLSWRKVETVQDYLNIHKEFSLSNPDGPVTCAPSSRVDAEAKIEGWACLGQNVIVEAGALVENSILWEGARVSSGVRVINSVLAQDVVADIDVTGTAKIA